MWLKVTARWTLEFSVLLDGFSKSSGREEWVVFKNDRSTRMARTCQSKEESRNDLLAADTAN
jgi:hypothetical protein